MLNAIKADIIRLKSDPSATKIAIAEKADELEKIKYELDESLGGFNAKDRANYEKKLQKLERSQKFAEQAEKSKEKKKKEGAPEAAPPPPPQKYIPGQKKDVSGKLLDAYHPENVEAVWDSWWESKKLFTPSNEPEPEKEKFVMVIPPPNVTGSLHIGHALTCSIEDALTRWHRMLGHKTLWLPGTDHAGIATQTVVEKQLLKEWEKDHSNPKTRQDMGREKFLERVWEFKHEKGGTILSQIRRLGASVDHSRTVFTMDEQNNRAVVEAFVRLYDQGKIYRATRLVHWSYALNTAISSIEVDDEVITADNNMRKVPGHSKVYKFGVFHNFAYKIHPDDIKPGMPDEIVVATTRLETMLGDVAVAVNPNDPKYKALHGVRLVHPYHPDRADFTVVVDSFVDIELGTGAVKITPAHDENDFQAAKRLNIDPSRFISIFDENGAIAEHAAGNASELARMMRYDARIWIMKDLERKGLFRGETPNFGQILPICSRSGDVVEPRLVPQWWVDCSEMAARACDAVEKKDLKIVPEFHEAVWFQWLRNIQPWCVSRQLWWGHRIPAWKIKSESAAPGKEIRWFVGRSENEARERARKELNLSSISEVPELEQDEDVLDTWFSSGLFPFASFGWPDANSKDLKEFFPGQLLETGHDILFFWVARMVMMSLALTDQLPFKTVYLHAMVRDKDGRKMSKTLGNVVDPVHVMEGKSLQYLIDRLKEGNLASGEVALAEKGMRENFPQGLPECGADALRFGLLAYTVQGRDINLDVSRIHSYRTFCNKIWNICRFCEGLVSKVFDPSKDEVFKATLNPIPKTRRDRWILHCLAVCVKECNDGFKNYQFGAITSSLYNFWYYNLADVYVEACKPVFRDDAANDRQSQIDCLNTLYCCLETGLRLMHPVMPFITEELWQHLAGHPNNQVDSICIAKYPLETTEYFAKLLADFEVEEEMKLVNDTTRAFRNLIAPVLTKQGGLAAKKAKAFIVVDEAYEKAFDEEALTDLGTLCKVEARPVLANAKSFDKDGMVEVVRAGIKLVVIVEGGAINVEAEAQKLIKKQEGLQKDLDDLSARVNNASYAQRAKPEVIAKDKQRLEELQNAIVTVKDEIDKLNKA
jgi:valyl-tRNA synthetase